MTATAPECPSCCAPMRLASDLAAAGLSRSWVCTDSTCPTVVPEEDGARLATRDDLLGAPVEALMRAPVTPQGGGGGSRGRREDKPGDRAAREALRERRYLDQEPAGGRDRDVVVEARRQKALRLDPDTEAWLEQASTRSGMSQQALITSALWAMMQAPWCEPCNLPGLPGWSCVHGCGGS